MKERNWINKKELKQWLGFKSDVTVHNWQKSGKLVYAKFGKIVMFDKTFIEEILNAQVGIVKSK